MRGQCVYLQVLVQMYMKGWNSHQLAERTGISYPSLRRKMRGASPLHLDEARKIQAVLGCGMTLDQLFARKETRNDR